MCVCLDRTVSAHRGSLFQSKIYMNNNYRYKSLTDQGWLYTNKLFSVAHHVSHVVNALFSSLLHSPVHLFLILKVSWNGPVHLLCCFFFYTPQTRLEKHGGCGEMKSRQAGQKCKILQVTTSRLLIYSTLKENFICMFAEHNTILTTHLDLWARGTLLCGPVAVVLLLPFHELAEMVLKQEGSVEFPHSHLIIYRPVTVLSV